MKSLADIAGYVTLRSAGFQPASSGVCSGRELLNFSVSSDSERRTEASMFSATDLFAYIRAAKLGVVSTLGPSGAPQSALVGIGVTEDLRIVFDTVSTSRKHANLVRDPRISLVIAGPAEKTLQYDGVASEIPVGGDEGREVREAYYASWPDGRERAVTWPTLRYWQIEPHWARYTDYDAEVLHAYFFGARPA